MKKDIDALSRLHQHHMNRAEDITQEWYEYRLALTNLIKTSEMGLSKTPAQGEMAPAFFLEVASNGVREEATMLRHVRMHRRKAERILKKLDKHYLKHPRPLDEMNAPASYADLATPVHL